MKKLLTWFRRRIGTWFFLRHRYLKVPFFLSVLISCFLALLYLAAYHWLQPEVPLFYSLAEPTDFLVMKNWLIIFPILSFFVTFVHFSLVHLLKSYDKIIQQFFCWASITAQVVFLIGMLRIILIIS